VTGSDGEAQGRALLEASASRVLASVALLGSVEAWSGDGRSIDVGTPRQRTLFALLCLRANTQLGIETLIRELWGTAPPASAANLLHTYMSRLRRGIDPGGQRWVRGGVLTSRGGGYHLALSPDVVDVTLFEQAVADAQRYRSHGDLGRAGIQLRRAMELWRDELCAGLSAPTINAERNRLAQCWLAAKQDQLDLELRMGRGGGTIAELRYLVTAHPTKERLVELLMLALYRDGRQSEAVELFAETRRRLDEDFGLIPGARLHELYVQMLRADSDLFGDDGDESVTVTSADRDVSPAQLPRDVREFTGRTAELALLDEICAAGTSVLATIVGTAGVGKTGLAVHWAHRVADRFPDGQLYVNLRGFDPVSSALNPFDVLGEFLDALGVPPQQVPLGHMACEGLYRSILAGRRMLVVLDNAADPEQVRPLLPGSDGCTVLVTSRHSLSGLVAVDGARRLDLDLLPLPDAVALLRGLVGPRVNSEPDAAAIIADQCARLPLALRVAAELAANRPTMRLADMANEMSDRRRRLDLLDASDDPRAAVTNVFSWSYRYLPAGAARLFRLLGLHPGPDVGADAAAVLAGCGLDVARDDLAVLDRAHLVQVTGTDRYGMHDLLRGYATILATTAAFADDVQPAQGRLFDYYLGTAAAAMDILYPAESGRRPQISRSSPGAPVLAEPAAAQAWLDAERPCLVAIAAYTAGNGWPTHAVHLSGILFRHLEGGHYAEGLAIHRQAEKAARGADDRAAEAQALLGLGAAHGQVGRYETAAEHLQRALLLAEEIDDQVSQGRALTALGNLERRLGRHGSAAQYHERALVLFQTAGDRIGEARTLTNLAIVYRRLGRYRAAADQSRRAVDLFRRADDRAGEAWALVNLGSVQARLGRHRPSMEHHAAALALFRPIGDRAGEAWTLDSLGAVYTDLGRPAEAVECHRRALRLFRLAGDRYGETFAQNGLGEAAYVAGHPAEALARHSAAQPVATATRARDQQARAHRGLGHAHRALGNQVCALEHYRKALTLYVELGMPEVDDVRAHLADGRSLI
jgi:DNA-binding SARP family transcriptional activator/tetratricopeptide (TPR) repeat protein